IGSSPPLVSASRSFTVSKNSPLLDQTATPLSGTTLSGTDLFSSTPRNNGVRTETDDSHLPDVSSILLSSQNASSSSLTNGIGATYVQTMDSDSDDEEEEVTHICVGPTANDLS